MSIVIEDAVIENSRILIVDDNKEIHSDFKKILNFAVEKPGDELVEMEEFLFEKKKPAVELPVYEIADAFQGDEAIEMVEKAEQTGQPYALAFMDVRMPPGINGIETIARIWENYPYLEVVICTAYSDASWDEIVARLGSTDRLLFLKKPFNSVEVKQIALSLVKKWNLNAQIRGIISNLEREVQERTSQLQKVLHELENTNKELAEKNRVLAELIHQDSLSGLLNHAAFYSRLHSAVSQSRRYHFPISLIMIDIDYFKKFNDTYGHQAGDEVIVKISEVLKESLRNFDVVIRYGEEPPQKNPEVSAEHAAGRYGGDEFALILLYCGPKEALTVTQRLSQKIREMQLKSAPGVQVTASLGIAVLDSDSCCDDCKKLLNLADKALYEAKSKGRDQVCILTYLETSGG